jgi:beta-lactamase regulating signal transducer with metallopeptidase domain
MHLQLLANIFEKAIPFAGGDLWNAWLDSSRTAAGVLVTSIWQSAIIAVAIAICLKMAPRISAAHRFALWAAGFVTAICLMLLPLLAHVWTGSGSDVSLSGFGDRPNNPWIQLDIRWSIALGGVWLAASIYRSVDLAIHAIRLRKIWKSAIPVEVTDELKGSEKASVALWGRSPVHIHTTKMLQRPSVIGFFAPRILIPDWLLERLTPGELDQIVLHEVEHLRRRDDWTNLLQKLSLVMFPLNPALWWMERRLCLEREMACDEGVIRVTHAPRAYAACLASLAERGLERRAEALSLGAWRRRSELVRRVHGILLRKRTLGTAAAGTLLGAMGFGLVFGSVELAQSPQLIAFVPAQRVETAQAVAPRGMQSEDGGLVRANFGAAHESGRRSGFYALQTAAVIPAVQGGKPDSNRVAAQRTPRKPPAEGASSTVALEAAPVAVRLQLAKAGAARALTDGGTEQQWVVLTQWEQVQTTSRGGPLTSDYDAEQSGNAMMNGDAKESAQPDRVTNRVIITQLILRVIPASSLSIQPALEQVRSGWFVFQL